MIARNGALLFGVNKPDVVTRVLPNAKHIRYKGKDLIAVKHTLDATRVLRNIGLKAPAPMQHDGFQWTGRFSPMSHQIATAEFCTIHPKCFVLNDTGTGKTAAALWAAEYLMQRGYIKRVLVICPVSVMKVWTDEAFSVLPHRTVGLMYGSRKKRLDILNGASEYCIINFDGVTSLYDSKKKVSELDGQFDLIIVDEASTYRSYNTNRYEALKHLNTLTTRLWLMTGTPTPNAPTDAWGMVKLVAPRNVPSSFKIMQETLMRQAGPYKWLPKFDAYEKVRQMMQPAIRYEKKDCLDLPPITYNSRYCELTDAQAKVFDVMKRRMKHEDEFGTEITAKNAAIKVLKLQQICCGVVKDNDENPVYLDAKPRLDLVTELIEQAPDKVIVFVPFLFAMDMLQAHLTEKGITNTLVNGKVSQAERGERFSAFQRDKEPRVLIAHPAVAAHGLTLTAASTIIWYAPIYSNEQYEQANARINRQGQKNAMSVYHVIGHPFEAAIYEVLQNKKSMQGALLGLYRQAVGA